MNELVRDQLVRLARNQIGVSRYQLKVCPSQAPQWVDCSSFTQWLLLQVGIPFPRLAFEQMHACVTHLPARRARSGDLIFRGGSAISYYQVCPVLGVDHVGLMTEVGTVIHASRSCGRVVEHSLVRFMHYRDTGRLAGSAGLWAGRIIT